MTSLAIRALGAAAVAAMLLSGAPATSADVELTWIPPADVVFWGGDEDPTVTSGFWPTLSSSLPAIGVPAMRSKYPFITGAGQTVVVIDTGIDHTHPALAAAYVGGWDFADNDPYPWDDASGHGTHVAGIVASRDATYGGVAPAANVVALKVFSSSGGGATWSNIQSALQWVVNNAATYNITAVNMSLGDSTQSTASSAWTGANGVLQQLKNMGIFVTAAAGNEGYLHGVSNPAASRYTVSVGGTWDSDDWSSYRITWNTNDPYDPYGYVSRLGESGPAQGDIMAISNRYTTVADGQLDLFAPGVLVTSAFPLWLDTTDGNRDGWASLLGTSMAAPHVAGASMLVRQALELNGMLDPDPAKQVDQILAILQDHATPLNDWYWSLYNGTGNHANIVEIPSGSGVWYVRPGSSGGNQTYSQINLDAAISFIAPVPEPGAMALLAAALGWVALAARRRRARHGSRSSR